METHMKNLVVLALVIVSTVAFAKGNKVTAEQKAEAKKACLNFLESLGIKDIEKNQTRKGYPNLILENKVHLYN